MKNVNYNQTDSRTFGNLIYNFRCSLGLTQEELGNILLTSRVTVVKLEKSLVVSDCSNELLFKLYYYATKIIENDKIDDLVKLNTENIYNSVELELNRRTNINDVLQNSISKNQGSRLVKSLY